MIIRSLVPASGGAFIALPEAFLFLVLYLVFFKTSKNLQDFYKFGI
jgi:hypothetical protein